nr:hypothetical protein [Actinomycetota bacterium]
MTSARIVVDGSNIATEGRSIPSLTQLDEAVRQLQQEMPDHQVIVVVDATFGHRIDPSEKPDFDEAEAHGEVVSPPAGTIGRGDAFLLQVAQRADAMVLSNDSFQEFHGDHEWLFEAGRLIGGKPVPGVGWIFTARTPVRGARSRAAVAAAKGSRSPRTKRATAGASTASAGAPAIGATATGPVKRARGTRKPAALPAGNGSDLDQVDAPVAVAKGAALTAGRAVSAGGGRRRTSQLNALPDTADAISTDGPDEAESQGGRNRRRSRRSTSSANPVNEPLTFLTFVTEHPIGDALTGTVEEFVSHGAMVQVGEMRCYVPLRNLGRPAPTRAREVLVRGEQRRFVLVGLDPNRRGAELALPELADLTATAAPASEPRPAIGATKRVAGPAATPAIGATKRVAGPAATPAIGATKRLSGPAAAPRGVVPTAQTHDETAPTGRGRRPGGAAQTPGSGLAPVASVADLAQHAAAAPAPAPARSTRRSTTRSGARTAPARATEAAKAAGTAAGGGGAPAGTTRSATSGTSGAARRTAEKRAAATTAANVETAPPTVATGAKKAAATKAHRAAREEATATRAQGTKTPGAKKAATGTTAATTAAAKTQATKKAATGTTAATTATAKAPGTKKAATGTTAATTATAKTQGTNKAATGTTAATTATAKAPGTKKAATGTTAATTATAKTQGTKKAATASTAATKAPGAKKAATAKA